MCGRYANATPAADLGRLFGTVPPTPQLQPSWNIAPSQEAAVVRCHPQTGERHLDLLFWGLLPAWARGTPAAPRPINARAERIATAPMFRDAYRARRCIVPASAFYEWRRASGGKQPFAFAREGNGPIAFAGLWEGFRRPDGEIVRSFAIITTAANAVMAPIHERMPVILEPEDWPLWLGEIKGDPACLLHPAAEGVLRCWPVSTRVNSPANNDARLLLPLAAPPA